MSKLVQLKDNEGNVFPTTLNDLYLTRVGDWVITDNSSKTIEIEDNRTYVYINSHIYMLSIYIFQYYSVVSNFVCNQICTTVKNDTTFENDGTSLTITANYQSRGKLFILPYEIRT